MSDEYVKPKWFEQEIVTCPTCKEDYRRMIFDRQQIVCPRCINRELIESNDE